MARYITANDLLRNVAVEVGLAPETDPYSSQNTIYTQLKALLDVAGQELTELWEWSDLNKTFSFVTVDGQTVYDLPDDYGYIINQTGWDNSNQLPIGGPLTSQTWAYLKGRDLASQTIYATFRMAGDSVELMPDPPPVGVDISFQYISRNWVQESGSEITKDKVGSGSDLILFDQILISRYLKAKHLDSKGFDAAVAYTDFETMFNARTGRDKGAQILSASRGNRSFPLISPYRNVGDTGYGLP